MEQLTTLNSLEIVNKKSFSAILKQSTPWYLQHFVGIDFYIKKMSRFYRVFRIFPYLNDEIV